VASVLVTGGTGFVGSHLIEALLRRGDQVRGLVRNPARAQALAFDGVEWMGGDLSDREALGRAVRTVEVIYHVAGLVAVHSEAEGMAVNRDGTARLLEAARETGARFVFVSSLAAAGPAPVDRPLTGDEPPAPITAYGRSKLAAEALIRRSPLPWVILRPPAVYGPRDREMLRIFAGIVRFGIAPVFGAGDQQLSLVYGPDLAEAIARAGASPDALGRILYPTHPEILTSTGLVRGIAAAAERRVRVVRIPVAAGRMLLSATGTIAGLTGRATILNRDKGNEFFAPAWTCDASALTGLTGWRASHDLARGARATLAWYRSAGWL
jgi:nucleoside-diphosphate-sugar epimerase